MSGLSTSSVQSFSEISQLKPALVVYYTNVLIDKMTNLLPTQSLLGIYQCTNHITVTEVIDLTLPLILRMYIQTIIHAVSTWNLSTLITRLMD